MDAAPPPDELVEHPCRLLRLDPESALRTVEELCNGADGEAKCTALTLALQEHGSFDLLPIAVQQRLHPDPFHQEEAVRDGAMHTTTTLRLALEPVRIRSALLEEPWTWWRHGKVVRWTRRGDGGTRFILFPMWLRSPARVGVELEPPVATEERSDCGETRPKTLIAARFFADFSGPGRYEIVHAPGGSVLRSVFDGVRRAGFTRVMPLAMVLDLHVRAESGRLRFPFPAETGFGGLVEA